MYLKNHKIVSGRFFSLVGSLFILLTFKTTKGVDRQIGFIVVFKFF